MIDAAIAFVAAGYAALLLWRGRLWLPVRLPFAARHLRWAAGLWIGYALPALVLLAMMGRLDAAAALPREFVAMARWLGTPQGTIGLETVAIGLGAGSLLGLIATWWRARRGRAPWTAGDATSLMPRSDADLLPAAWLAVSAGVGEELFYRAALPLAIARASGSGLAGCVVATLCFAGMHRYQGRIGVAATLVGGALMTVLYCGSGALWLPIVAHALTDLNALVLRPALSARVRRRIRP